MPDPARNPFYYTWKMHILKLAIIKETTIINDLAIKKIKKQQLLNDVSVYITSLYYTHWYGLNASKSYSEGLETKKNAMHYHRSSDMALSRFE